MDLPILIELISAFKIMRRYRLVEVHMSVTEENDEVPSNAHFRLTSDGSRLCFTMTSESEVPSLFFEKTADLLKPLGKDKVVIESKDGSQTIRIDVTEEDFEVFAKANMANYIMQSWPTN